MHGMRMHRAKSTAAMAVAELSKGQTSASQVSSGFCCCSPSWTDPWSQGEAMLFARGVAVGQWPRLYKYIHRTGL